MTINAINHLFLLLRCVFALLRLQRRVGLCRLPTERLDAVCDLLEGLLVLGRSLGGHGVLLVILPLDLECGKLQEGVQAVDVRSGAGREATELVDQSHELLGVITRQCISEVWKFGTHDLRLDLPDFLARLSALGVGYRNLRRFVRLADDLDGVCGCALEDIRLS